MIFQQLCYFGLTGCLGHVFSRTAIVVFQRCVGAFGQEVLDKLQISTSGRFMEGSIPIFILVIYLRTCFGQQHYDVQMPLACCGLADYE